MRVCVHQARIASMVQDRAHTAEAAKVRYGRKAEVSGNAAMPRRWRSSRVDAREIDFRFTPDNRHTAGEVGFR